MRLHISSLFIYNQKHHSPVKDEAFFTNKRNKKATLSLLYLKFLMSDTCQSLISRRASAATPTATSIKKKVIYKRDREKREKHHKLYTCKDAKKNDPSAIDQIN